MRTCRVLLVDDEPFILQGLSVLIDWEQEGYEIVKMAQNGLEAWEYLQTSDVDLVITDIRMPVMNGLEFLKRVYELKEKEVHSVILSGYSDFEYAKQAIRYACTEYMLKPVQKIELLDMLRRVRRDVCEKESQEMDLVQEKADCFCKAVVCDKSIEKLLRAIDGNQVVEICTGVEQWCEEMLQHGMTKDVMSANTEYFRCQLLHLAMQQDESVVQEEVMQYLSENLKANEIADGNRMYIRRFACEYAEYLMQLRKKISRGILQEIEKEIKEHYAENLTLKELGKKYYINSSYLGQVFRKKYGQSFKDYLCAYRINEAAQLLLKTDEKISMVAEQVGYHDTDYFIGKFIEMKGCTPAKFRKNH